MYSRLSAEERVPADHPLRVIRETTHRILLIVDFVFQDLFTPRPGCDPVGETVCGLLHRQGTNAGATQLQPAVPLVCRQEPGRYGWRWARGTPKIAIGF
jgi:hypothetical protein